MKIGPIPTDDGLGKEVITRMTANMATNKIYYADSNGRDFLKRVSLRNGKSVNSLFSCLFMYIQLHNQFQVRDYRSDWTLDVHQPVSGNYYPVSYQFDNNGLLLFWLHKYWMPPFLVYFL